MQNDDQQLSEHTTQNPYEAPKSELRTEADIAAESAEPYFFTTAPLKFVVMSICTFGLYELYWFYKNWVLIRNRTGRSIMPVWRTIFAPLWAYSVFSEVHNTAAEHHVPSSMSPGFLAFGYFIIAVLSNGPDPIWLIALIGFLTILPANNVAIRLNQALSPDAPENHSFTPLNLVWIVIGLIFLVLVVLGTFFVDDAGNLTGF